MKQAYNASRMTGTPPWHSVIHLIITTTLLSWCYYNPYFIDEEIKIKQFVYDHINNNGTAQN